MCLCPPRRILLPHLLIPILLIAGALLPSRADALELTARQQGVGLIGGTVTLEVTVADLPADQETVIELFTSREVIRTERLGVGTHTVVFERLVLPPEGESVLYLRAAGSGGTVEAAAPIRTIPGWLSIVPPLVAIGLALLFKDVLVSLFLGVFVGALILVGWNPFAAFAATGGEFLVPSLTDSGNAQIVVFSLLLGGMVGVISRSGGMQGVVDRLAGWATSPRSGQLATWWMGIAIFFDDYANTLLVGSTMRPVTDRLKISREKLAYMVDSTAAPVASLVPISTWIGYELGLIGNALESLDLAGEGFSAFGVFLASIPYRFYPIFALVLGFTIATTGRDFGPMLKAEKRAARGDGVLAAGDTPLADYQNRETEPPEGQPRHALDAVLPVLTVITVTIYGLLHTGIAAVGPRDGALGTWLREVFANGDSYAALLWASLAGVVVATALPVARRVLRLKDAMEGMLAGLKAMLLAMVVLVLAWSIGAVCEQLHTATWLVSATEGVLSPHWMPALVFVLSAFIAFATGSSWGAMGILFPLVVPTLHGIAVQAGYDPGSATYATLLAGVVSSVLAGTVWGDHCSPISDTTILSSMASGSDHIAHVRTQLPYALGVGILGLLLGDLATAFGLDPWIALLLGAALIVGTVLWFGKRSRPDDAPGKSAGNGGGEPKTGKEAPA